MSTPPTNGPPTSLLNLDLRPSGSAKLTKRGVVVETLAGLHVRARPPNALGEAGRLTKFAG